GFEIVLDGTGLAVGLRQRVEGNPPDAGEQNFRPSERVGAADGLGAGFHPKADNDAGGQPHGPREHPERGGELLGGAALAATVVRAEKEERQIRVCVTARRVGDEFVMLGEELLNRLGSLVRRSAALGELLAQLADLLGWLATEAYEPGHRTAGRHVGG